MLEEGKSALVAWVDAYASPQSSRKDHDVLDLHTTEEKVLP